MLNTNRYIFTFYTVVRQSQENHAQRWLLIQDNTCLGLTTLLGWADNGRIVKVDYTFS